MSVGCRATGLAIALSGGVARVALVALVALPVLAEDRTPETPAETPLQLCGEHTAELGKGAVIYLDKPPTQGKGVALTACGVIEAAPPAVWPVIRDCAEYQHFLPGVTRSDLNLRNGNTALCESLIELPFPLGKLNAVERVVESERAGVFERRWTLERGNYRRLNGSWTLFSWEGGRTLAVYRLDMDPDTIVPDFLLRSAQQGTARGVFDAIRSRVRWCMSNQKNGTCTGK